MTQKYQAYLLRLWQTDDFEEPTWLASLEDPATRQVTGFASLEALCSYILQKKRHFLQAEERHIPPEGVPQPG
jgi:hypothetical protein